MQVAYITGIRRSVAHVCEQLGAASSWCRLRWCRLVCICHYHQFSILTVLL